MGNTIDKAKTRKIEMHKTKRKQVADFEYVDYLADIIKTITKIDIFKNTREVEYVEARSLLVYILRDVEYLTYYGIRDYFNSKGKAMDHATALHSYKNYPIYAKYNPKIGYWFDLLMDASNVAAAKKIQAKTIIDNSEPFVSDFFIYMYKKSLDEKID